MIKLKGIPASGGIRLGPAFVFPDQELKPERRTVQDVDAEWQRLERALEVAAGQLEALRAKTEAEAGAEEAAIFGAHVLFLKDPTLLDTVRKTIREEKRNAEAAWSSGTEGYARQLEAMGDSYFSARAADVRDVGRRVLRALMGLEEADLSDLRQPSVVLARDLTPSDTARLDKSLVLAFCTAEGGPTSHTAILAKALRLPAVVGLGPALLEVTGSTPLLVDGEAGEVVVEPDEATRRVYEARARQEDARAKVELEAAHQPAVTRDGHAVEVVANVGNLEDAEIALEYGAEGIGLLRTEFLYLDRQTAPDEERQFSAYEAILDAMATRPVVVRTLDVGGDKELPYLDLGQEANPFLGWRAIRMCLDQPDFFKTQLRALLRASPGHDLRIMFPMIATLDEVRRAKALLQEAKEEVLEAGHQVAGRIQVGIMVEVPSVAVLADLFAKEVDFFSIGTNDLTQYTMAAERTNERVAHLGDACHPAVLRQVERVIAVGHQAGRWVGVCGELAGDADAVPILLGLGLDEFSMAPGSIPRAKAIVRRWTLEGAQGLAAQILALDSAEAVREAIRAASAKLGEGL